MLTITPVPPEDRACLWILLQRYLREMSVWYGDQPDGTGHYPYPWFDSYFTDSERAALFLEREGQRAGFALINRHSCIGEAPDHAMAEFCILAEFRGKGLGLMAARGILQRWPGSWEIKYHRENRAAGALWTRAAAPYSPKVTVLGEERVLSFLADKEVSP